MVSRRSRDKNTVGSRLSNLQSDLDQAKKSSGLSTGEVKTENLDDNAVDRSAIAPNAVGSAEIDRGAVGTDHLGIVNSLKSDSNFDISTPGSVTINGSPIPYPGAATTAASGIVELATDAETVTGTDTVRAVTPSNITGRQASAAEVLAATNTTKLVTPASLKVNVMDRITSLETQNSSSIPWTYRVPSSVVVSSGTAATAADGTVTFTGAVIVKLNGVFRAGKKYRIFVSDLTSATAGYIYAALQVGGSIVGGSNWNGMTMYMQSATWGSFFQSTVANTPLMGYANTGTPNGDFEIEVNRPFLSYPRINLIRSYYATTTVWGGYYNTLGTVLNADGFWFQGDFAMTGKIQVVEL